MRQWGEATPGVIERRLQEDKQQLEGWAIQLQRMLAVLTGHSFRKAELSHMVQLSQPRVHSGRKLNGGVRVVEEEENDDDVLSSSGVARSLEASFNDSLLSSSPPSTTSRSSSDLTNITTTDVDTAVENPSRGGGSGGGSGKTSVVKKKKRKRRPRVDRSEIIMHPIVEEDDFPGGGTTTGGTGGGRSGTASRYRVRSPAMRRRSNGVSTSTSATGISSSSSALKRQSEGDALLGNSASVSAAARRPNSPSSPSRPLLRRTPNRRRNRGRLPRPRRSPDLRLPSSRSNDSLPTTSATATGTRSKTPLRRRRRRKPQTRRPKSSAPRLWEKFVVEEAVTASSPPRKRPDTILCMLEQISKRREKTDSEKQTLLKELSELDQSSLSSDVRSDERVRNLDKSQTVHRRLRHLGRKEIALVREQVATYHEGMHKQLERQQTEEKSGFDAEWESIWSKYDEHAKMSRARVKKHQAVQERELEKQLREQAPSLRHTRTFLDLQKRVQLLIERKKYSEATALEKQLMAQDARERERHSDHLRRAHTSKMQALHDHFSRQDRRVREEMNQKVGELRLKHEKDLRAMNIRHRNAREALKQSQRKRESVVENRLRLQEEVLQSHDAKSSIDFTNLHIPGLEEILESSSSMRKNPRVARLRRRKSGTTMTPRTRGRARAPALLGSPFQGRTPSSRGKTTRGKPGRLLPIGRTSFFDRS